PSSACSASKLCGGSRRRMSSAPGRRVTFDESFSGSMAELLKETRGPSTTANRWCGQEYLKAGDKSRTARGSLCRPGSFARSAASTDPGNRLSGLLPSRRGYGQRKMTAGPVDMPQDECVTIY